MTASFSPGNVPILILIYLSGPSVRMKAFPGNWSSGSNTARKPALPASLQACSFPCRTTVFPPDTVVTWVTMPESRRRERAVDHGRLLAEAFAEKLSLPCRQLLLRRDRREKRQVGLNEKERAANLAGAFTPKEKITFPVLIVDDVRTTGTTLCRCAEALRSGGAEKIFGLTVTARK